MSSPKRLDEWEQMGVNGVYRGGSITQNSEVVNVRYKRGDRRTAVYYGVGFRFEWCNKEWSLHISEYRVSKDGI